MHFKYYVPQKKKTKTEVKEKNWKEGNWSIVFHKPYMKSIILS